MKKRLLSSIVVLFMVLGFCTPIQAIEHSKESPSSAQDLYYTIKEIADVQHKSIIEKVEKGQALEQKKEQEEEIQTEEEEPVTQEVVEENYMVPYPHKEFITYEYYTSISPYSAQGELQAQAYTGDYGIRMVDGCYLVAMGSAYASHIGQRFRIVFTTGQTIDVMIGDFKSDEHTDEYNSAASNGDILEFIIEYAPGDVPLYGSYSIIFPGTVEKIIIL